MSDERLNLPSASSAAADASCPGRFKLHSQFPIENSEWSKIGTRIHNGMAGLKVDLSSDQLDWIQKARAIEHGIRDAWTNRDGGWDFRQEARLWAFDENGQKTNSGQADIFWLQRGRALLADYKSLFGDVPDVAENMQLRDLAVLIHLNYGVTEVTAYINQPRVTRNPKLVVYSLDDLKRAEVEMRERVKASMDPNSPRIPGEEQCKYCNGKLHCLEFQALATKPISSLTRFEDLETKPKVLKPMLEQRVALLEPRVLTQLRDTLKLTEMLQTAVNAEIRKRLTADRTSVPGLTLAEGNKVRSISDIMKAWELICVRGMVVPLTSEQFSQCCSISIGKLEDAIRANIDCTADEAKTWINEVLGPIITLKANAASIERVKE